jgi:RimJ/RimL family protein N-acetyltransferase
MPLLPTTLAGHRVRLEPLTHAHAPDLQAVTGDPELWRYMSFGSLADPGNLRTWIDAMIAERQRGDGHAFAIVDLASGRAIGSSSYFDFTDKDRWVEIGRTWLGRPYWRTAINTECKYLLLRNGFEELKLNRVQLKTDARNLRSQAAISRLGAVREGVLRAHMVMSDGYLRDTVMYSITASEWPAVKAGLEERMRKGSGC